MPSQDGVRQTLADYPVSLQSAARALWGDDFWGSSAPKPRVGPPKPYRLRRTD